MKTAYFVRHAKSSWKNEGLTDHNRPLNKRGKRDAPFMAQQFLEQEQQIPLLISSTAVRALATAKHFCNVFNLKVDDIIQEPSLYNGSSSDFENILFQQEDTIDSVMIFSHNPGLTFFANDYTSRSIDNVPTTGIFKLESAQQQWTYFFNDAKLTKFIYPKMFQKE